jgi:hypothetical protein
MLFFPTQVSHLLARSRTCAFSVRGRRLTAWIMAQPHFWIMAQTHSSVTASLWIVFKLLIPSAQRIVHRTRQTKWLVLFRGKNHQKHINTPCGWKCSVLYANKGKCDLKCYLTSSSRLINTAWFDFHHNNSLILPTRNNLQPTAATLFTEPNSNSEIKSFWQLRACYW